jgi:hypothetical protein
VHHVPILPEGTADDSSMEYDRQALMLTGCAGREGQA